MFCIFPSLKPFFRGRVFKVGTGWQVLKPVVSPDGAFEQSRRKHVSPSSLCMCHICRPEHTPQRVSAEFECGCAHSCPL